jgi:hypothetical protein
MKDGINRAIDHASRVHECDWKEVALNFLIEYLAKKESGHLFTCEEVRGAFEEKGFPLPPDDRAWGGVIRKAAGKDYRLIVKDSIVYVGANGRFGARWCKR